MSLKGSLFRSLNQTRVFVNTTLSGAGNLAVFVDQKEIVPQNKVMLLLSTSLTLSTNGSTTGLALYLATESLRNVAPIDPAKMLNFGPSLQTGLTPIFNSLSQMNGVAPSQGNAVNSLRPIVVPYGFFIKGLTINSSSSAVAQGLYLDYSWLLLDEDCPVQI